MDSAERHELILRALRDRDRVPVAELAELTGCSEMTVRRDLDLLERNGLLRRVRGAAVGVLTGEETPYPARSRHQVAAKQRIGAAVADLIDDGESVALDSGTTTLEVAKCLVDRRLTVLPLSLHAVDVLRGSDQLRLVVPGGDLRPAEQSFVGPLTEHVFDVVRLDTAVLGCCGITARDGVSAYDLGEAQVKRAAVHASKRVIAAVDSSKLGRTAFGRVCPVSDVHVLVTDSAAPAEQVEQFQAQGVEVVLV
ncbi:DeoR/GlpR family DNA-binding transcription regulator [Kutzneria viridogrisea]|uniref:DeoR family transcription regulator n=2 Tax=Kutzneria TaxID=43356 RepID=W5WG53_9PSEU|nr:DeoR/GlpR family DNA-binding transcription regulator [Kutzneria albida]AHH97124.1 DeoR family transcription regulator [Kutzneria albida DSM 43870]MBA8931905.1 DeoR/GlpR family transcriptional regulator of sugar metabolism [Kutzneria viridogrisea]